MLGRNNSRPKRTSNKSTMQPIVLDISKEQVGGTSMNPVSKPFYQSTTTQNVAVGAVTGQGVALGLISILRKVAPGIIVWSEDQDQTVAQVLGIILTPLLSRLLAVLRKGTA